MENTSICQTAKARFVHAVLIDIFGKELMGRINNAIELREEIDSRTDNEHLKHYFKYTGWKWRILENEYIQYEKKIHGKIYKIAIPNSNDRHPYLIPMYDAWKVAQLAETQQNRITV